jgi:prepilin-type N-terminal cleavage/methylation domain-containing protein
MKRVRLVYKSKGFTIIEVLFAVVILSAALIPLLGLQSASLHRTSRNEHEFQATLIAQQLLSFIEKGEWSEAEWNSVRPANEMLQQVSQRMTGIRYQHPDENSLLPYSVRLVTVPWTLPQIQIPLTVPLAKMTITVFWGEAIQEQIQLTYLIPLEVSSN